MNSIHHRVRPAAFYSARCWLCLLAIVFAPGQAIAQPHAARGDEPAGTAKTPADLDPATRRRYEEARLRLRQAEDEQRQRDRDADAADPLLALARQAELKARKFLEESRGPLGALRSEYAERGDTALADFNEWQRWYSTQSALAYFKRLAADARQRPLLTQFCEQELKNRANNPQGVPPQLQTLLPDKDANLKGDEALNLFQKIGETEAALTDGAALEKKVAPSAAAKETYQGLAQARLDLMVYGLYVRTKTM
ncbi:MAG TPA: hypothetical protein VGG30_09140, partial [Pirellulales bacterium]